MTVLISVAHSKNAPGVCVADNATLQEYMVSLRASLVAMKNLAGEHEVLLFDAGDADTAKDYCGSKVRVANALMPRLAVEIHCNAGPPDRNYSEVIYNRNSSIGKQAATVIARTLSEGFKGGHHKEWQARGARPNTVKEDKKLFFFTELTHCPAVIVEGLFLTNPEQADWLARGGQEAYGLLVAEGIRRFLKGEKA